MTVDNDTSSVVIVSCPWCEPRPMVAPALLSACLNGAGISARAYDLNAEFTKHFKNQSWFIDFKHWLTMSNIVRPQFPKQTFREIMTWLKRYLGEIIHQHKPIWIGISVFTSESLDFGLLISYTIRRWFPHCRIIAGGKGLEVQANNSCTNAEMWITHNVADTVVIGDAETAVIDVIKNDRRGLIVAPAQSKSDLDRIPLTRWDDYDLDLYRDLIDTLDTTRPGQQEAYLSVTSSKGCVRQCTFCDVASFWPKFLMRDPDKVAQEIIHNYESTGITLFRFTDNLINGSISGYRRINQVLAQQIPRTIRYTGYAIFRGQDQMPASDFELAAEAGCINWQVGVESGSERLRFEMRKKFTDQDLDWSINQLAQNNITQTWLLMVGYPSESRDDFQATCDLLHRYKWLAQRSLIRIQVTPTFHLLSNSPLLRNQELAHDLGLTHNQNLYAEGNKFWTSSVMVDNTFTERSRRWRHLIKLAQDSGYQFGDGMPLEKWMKEIDNLDEVYAAQHKQTWYIRKD